MTYYDVVARPSFFRMLTRFDRDIATTMHEKEHCLHCPGKLDRADYFRSGHGMPGGVREEDKRRFSFCCRRCRRRRTPDSLRFLDGKPYPGVIVTLLALLQHGETAARIAALRKALGVDHRTLGRWRRWWLEDFAESALWRGARGLLPVDGADLPIADRLAQVFAAGRTLAGALVELARFLAPWRRQRPK